MTSASVAGLLANLGKLFDLDEEFSGRPWGYGEVGAYLLGLWGFPLDVVHAVAYHRSPRHLPRTDFNLLGITHVANALISGDAVDEDYLDRCGQTDSLAHWRALAASIQQNARRQSSRTRSCRLAKQTGPDLCPIRHRSWFEPQEPARQ